MNQDEDIQKLLSWLQMPDLVYRDFAGTRDVSDAPGPAPVHREYIGDEVRRAEEDAAHASVAESSTPEPVLGRRPRRPAMIAPEPSGEGEPQGDRPLNQVFDRLGPSQNRLPDPRDRMRNIPPLGPPRGRSR